VRLYSNVCETDDLFCDVHRCDTTGHAQYIGQRRLSHAQYIRAVTRLVWAIITRSFLACLTRRDGASWRELIASLSAHHKSISGSVTLKGQLMILMIPTRASTIHTIEWRAKLVAFPRQYPLDQIDDRRTLSSRGWHITVQCFSIGADRSDPVAYRIRTSK